MTRPAGLSSSDRRLALVSIAASAGLALLKLNVAGMSGSLALLGSALDAGLDIGVTAVTYLVVRMSERPPDEEHHFGYLRLESISALPQTLVLLAVGGFVVHSALRQLSGSAMTMQMGMTPLAVGALLVSGAVDLWRSFALARAAKRSGSPALAAAALSFRLDFLTTIVALLGLLTVGTGFRIADPIAAGCIGVVMLASAFRLLRDTFHGMTDRAPVGVSDVVRDAAKTIAAVIDVESIRVRRIGARTFIELTITVDADQRMRDVQTIKESVSRAIALAVDNAECTILAMPTRD